MRFEKKASEPIGVLWGRGGNVAGPPVHLKNSGAVGLIALV